MGKRDQTDFSTGRRIFPFQQVVERATEMAETFHAKVILLHVRQRVLDILGEPYYQKVLNQCSQVFA